MREPSWKREPSSKHQSAEDGADVLTPLPIRSEELGSLPNLAAPASERTGEIQVDELESYEDDDA